MAYIKYKTGDIFMSEMEAVVNTVNCEGVAGRGVAFEFRRRYPENHKAYVAACQSNKLRPGTLFITEPSISGQFRYIINFPTKDTWRRESKMEYVSSGLDALAKAIPAKGIRSIAIPALGCGLGGLNWNVVKSLIVDKLKDIPAVIVEIYEPIH